LEALKGKSLLLVEDNDLFIDGVVALFQLFFKEVHVAKNLTQAREALAQNIVDCMICDIHLGHENGLGFIQEYRDSGGKIPIVVLSGRKDEELLFQALTLRLSGYLLKPINHKHLIETLTACAKELLHQQRQVVTICEGMVYYPDNQVILCGEQRLALNRKEILFFDMVVEHHGKVLSKDLFWEHIWGYEEMSPSALNNFVMRLRRRFGRDFLHTLPDVGYIIAM
jgi:two-component system, OmpR family, response regulator VanR